MFVFVSVVLCQIFCKCVDSIVNIRTLSGFQLDQNIVVQMPKSTYLGYFLGPSWSFSIGEFDSIFSMLTYITYIL